MNPTVEKLRETMAEFVAQYERWWPSHATGSIGGMSCVFADDPKAVCVACSMKSAYEKASAALEKLSQAGGGEGA